MKPRIARECRAHFRFWVLSLFQPNHRGHPTLKALAFKLSYGRFFVFSPRAVPGIRVRARAWDVGDFLVAREIFAGGIYPLERLSEKPDLIIDLGGHIGMFSLLAAARFPGTPIEVFEPCPDNYRLLDENLAGVPAAAIHHVAISDRRGKMAMGGQSGVAMKLKDSAAPGEPIVPVDRLETFVDLSRAQRLLLKCDIEGSEFAVLPTILDQLPDDTCMLIEVHEGRPSVNRLAGLLHPLGFALFTHRHAKGEAIDCVALRGRFQTTALGDSFAPYA